MDTININDIHLEMGLQIALGIVGLLILIVALISGVIGIYLPFATPNSTRRKIPPASPARKLPVGCWMTTACRKSR